MNCDRCSHQKAVVRITKINEDGSAYHLNLGQCDDCLKEIKYCHGPVSKSQGPVDELLKQLLKDQAAAPAEKTPAPSESDLVCLSCGLEFADYRSTGMLGCPACYDSFADMLMPDLKRYHGAAYHAGFDIAAQDGIDSLTTRLQAARDEMKDALEYEDYDRAAELRDEMERLQKAIAGHTPGVQQPSAQR